MPAGRVHLALGNFGTVGQSGAQAMILTGGSGAPLVTLADNVRFPGIAEMYARSELVSSGGGQVWCINLRIRFESPVLANALAIAVNCYQDDAREFTFPWFGLAPGGAVVGSGIAEEKADHGKGLGTREDAELGGEA